MLTYSHDSSTYLTQQNMASDQGLHYLLKGISIQNEIKMNKVHQTPLKLEMDSYIW